MRTGAGAVDCYCLGLADHTFFCTPRFRAIKKVKRLKKKVLTTVTHKSNQSEVSGDFAEGWAGFEKLLGIYLPQ